MRRRDAAGDVGGEDEATSMEARSVSAAKRRRDSAAARRRERRGNDGGAAPEEDGDEGCKSPEGGERGAATGKSVAQRCRGTRLDLYR